jgi:hypothetical protein
MIWTEIKVYRQKGNYGKGGITVMKDEAGWLYPTMYLREGIGDPFGSTEELSLVLGIELEEIGSIPVPAAYTEEKLGDLLEQARLYVSRHRSYLRDAVYDVIDRFEWDIEDLPELHGFLNKEGEEVAQSERGYVTGFVHVYQMVCKVIGEDLNIQRHWFRTINADLKDIPENLLHNLEGVKRLLQYLYRMPAK